MSAATARSNEPGLISKFISHADKLPLVGNPLAGWTAKNKESISEKQQQQEVVYYRLSPRSSYAAAPPPPYEKVAANNSANANSSPSMLGKILSASGLTSSSQHSTNNHLTNIDTKQVEHAVTLINIASEMDQSGNQQMAFDLYMMGLDRMLSAFPLETNANMKRALEDKIREFKQEKRLDLDLPPADVTELSDSNMESTNSNTLAELIVNALVYSAVTLKRSPVPYVVTSIIACAKYGFNLVDNTCQIRKRTRDITSHSISKAMELERHYEIQERVNESMNAIYGALAKANMAYTEAPGFKEKEETVPVAA